MPADCHGWFKVSADPGGLNYNDAQQDHIVHLVETFDTRLFDHGHSLVGMALNNIGQR